MLLSDFYGFCSDGYARSHKDFDTMRAGLAARQRAFEQPWFPSQLECRGQVDEMTLPLPKDCNINRRDYAALSSSLPCPQSQLKFYPSKTRKNLLSSEQRES